MLVKHLPTKEIGVIAQPPIHDCPNFVVIPDNAPHTTVCWLKTDCEIQPASTEPPALLHNL